MTPAEKAKKLVDKYYNKSDLLYETLSFIQAKECALIAVNEVLGYMGADRGYEFWLQVKQEIEKL